MTQGRAWLAALMALWVIVDSKGSAEAHPHVWVTAKAEIVYEKGQIAAIQHHWTFDEFYTATAIQGLDKNGDGIYSREELAELAQTNMDGLKEFDFFTYALLGKEKVDFKAPVDAWLEHKAGILTLHYRLPLARPIPAATPGFSFATYDPSFFIAFELDKGQAVTLVGAPAGCKVAIGDFKEPDSSADNKTLTGAFTETMGAPSLGSGTSKSAYVTCPKP